MFLFSVEKEEKNNSLNCARNVNISEREREREREREILPVFILYFQVLKCYFFQYHNSKHIFSLSLAFSLLLILTQNIFTTKHSWTYLKNFDPDQVLSFTLQIETWHFSSFKNQFKLKTFYFGTILETLL